MLEEGLYSNGVGPGVVTRTPGLKTLSSFWEEVRRSSFQVTCS